MKAFLGGIAAMIVIAVVAAFALQNMDYVVDDPDVSDRGSVRLSNED